MKEGSLVWVEIPASNAAELKAFYSKLFPSWKWGDEGTPRSTHYMFESPAGLGGGITVRPSSYNAAVEQQNGSGMTAYYVVDSLDETAKKAQELGATVCVEKNVESTHGMWINFRDPQGNRFALYEMIPQ